MSDPKVIPVEDVVSFYNDLKTHELRTQYILSDYYREMTHLSAEELQQVMSVGVSARSVISFMKKTFNIEEVLNSDAQVKGFKLNDETMKIFSSMIVKFVMIKEQAQQKYVLH